MAALTDPTTLFAFYDVLKDIRLFQYSSCKISFWETLGEGTAMNVYEGTCNIDGVEKQVAFKYARQLSKKYLKPRMVQSIFTELQKEIKYMSRLKNVENIVQLYGLVKKDDDNLRPILILELADCNLEEYLQNQREEVDWNKNLNFCLQVAKGAHEMHRKRIIHGDIKGSNILVFENKEQGMVTLKLSDFGFSSSLSSSIGLTGETVQFTAPECLLAARDHPKMQKYYDTSSRHDPSLQLKDIYSYGLVAWQIANKGQTPFTSLSKQEIIEKKMTENLDDLLNELPKDTPKYFSEIIAATTKFIPSERERFPEVIFRISNLLGYPASPPLTPIEDIDYNF